MMNIIKNSDHQNPPKEHSSIKMLLKSLLRVTGYFFATLLIIIVGLFLYLQTEPARSLLRKYVAEIISQNVRVQLHMGNSRQYFCRF